MSYGSFKPLPLKRNNVVLDYVVHLTPDNLYALHFSAIQQKIGTSWEAEVRDQQFTGRMRYIGPNERQNTLDMQYDPISTLPKRDNLLVKHILNLHRQGYSIDLAEKQFLLKNGIKFVTHSPRLNKKMMGEIPFLVKHNIMGIKRNNDDPHKRMKAAVKISNIVTRRRKDKIHKVFIKMLNDITKKQPVSFMLYKRNITDTVTFILRIYLAQSFVEIPIIEAQEIVRRNDSKNYPMRKSFSFIRECAKQHFKEKVVLHGNKGCVLVKS